MYPFFEIFSWFYVYTFWLSLTICFFLFLWMLKRLCHRFWINEGFFLNRILWYFLSVFFFSRLFYVLSRFWDFKDIQKPIEFFFMNDYNFSLIGAFVWYFIVLYFSTVSQNLRSGKYVDVSILAFLFTSILWYIGAFFWGQVYGRETHLWIEVLYTNPFSPVPYEVPIFPLALFYALIFFIIFSIFYMSSMFLKVRGVTGYAWLVAIGATFLIGETLSGKLDMFKTTLGVWFNQLWALCLILVGIYGLYRIYKTPKTTDIIQ